MSVLDIYELTSRLAGVWVAVSAAESLSRSSDFGDNGAFAWKIMRLNRARRLSRADDLLGSLGFVIAVLAIRFAAGIALAISPERLAVLVVGWVAVAATSLFLRWRRRFGDDGSDQMLTIT